MGTARGIYRTRAGRALQSISRSLERLEHTITRSPIPRHTKGGFSRPIVWFVKITRSTTICSSSLDRPCAAYTQVLRLEIGAGAITPASPLPITVSEIHTRDPARISSQGSSVSTPDQPTTEGRYAVALGKPLVSRSRTSSSRPSLCEVCELLPYFSVPDPTETLSSSRWHAEVRPYV